MITRNNSVKITCPNNNIEERKYVIDVLFGYVGTGYSIEFDDSAVDYVVTYGQKSIEIKDDFFSHFPDILSYLNANNIPSQTKSLKCGMNFEPVIIYGEDTYRHTDDTIYCGLDIFASAFFMLARWEEQVIDKKNNLGRCDENELLSVRNNFYKRPIVNEYVDLMGYMLESIGIVISPNYAKYKEVLLTHDVDRVYLSGVVELLKNTQRMIASGDTRKALTIISRYVRYRVRGDQPFNSFNDLMIYSGKYGLKNSFFFKACEQGEKGYTYSVKDTIVQEQLKDIQSGGHIIGFHPSENTVDDRGQFDLELSRLQSTVETEVHGGRSHQLRYSEQSLEAWSENNLGYDSGCGFQFYNGFRAGICYPYPMFNNEARKVLNLSQKPFIIMDSVWLRNKQDPDEFYREAVELFDIVMRYNGTICMNWHSNLINTIEMDRVRSVYYKLVDYVGDNYGE